jgi:hypothetical protein
MFGGMTADDDKKDMGPNVEVLGRWSTLGEGAGYCICKATDTVALGTWLLNWITMATIAVTPVVDDNQARQIILGKPADFCFDYSNVKREPTEGESLYMIEYTFIEGCKSQGFDLFGNMSQEDDKRDAGNNLLLGRWHDLATGAGVAVCASSSEFNLQSWAYNWKNLCKCKITPVLTDAQFRHIVQSKPDFAKKQTSLMDKMNPPKKRWW